MVLLAGGGSRSPGAKERTRWRSFFSATCSASSPSTVVCALRPDQLRAKRLKIHILRSAIYVTAMISWFWALTLVPLAEATALGYFFFTELAGFWT